MINGEQLIKALCDRLNFQGQLLYDANILNLLRELSVYQVNELVTFGELVEWRRQRIENEQLNKEV